jgi:glutathione S-transferase
MLELFQTEWCPSSRRVRQRLTELGVDYVVHQVPVERSERRTLLDTTGADSIPVLVLENGSPVVGEDAILACLAERFAEPAEADAHRARAESARRRYLEEECECSQPRTRSARGRPPRSRRQSSGSARS